MLSIFGRSIPTTVDEVLAERCALVIWDMQEGIARRATNLPTLLSTIPQLTQLARKRGYPVVYSQHYSPPMALEDRAWIRSQWERSGRGELSKIATYAPGSAGWEFIPETAPTSSDLVVPKSRPSLFVGTPIRLLLAAQCIDVVVMTGVATDRGVLSTVRDAVNQGVMMVIVEDAVGTFSEAAQKRGIEQLREICDVCSTSDVIRCWAKARPPN